MKNTGVFFAIILTVSVFGVTASALTAAPGTDRIAAYFSARQYAGNARKYALDDLKVPQTLAGILATNRLSWLALLRNEISARHGYVFSTAVYKDVFGKTSWYVPDPAFDPSRSLTPAEQSNVGFIRQFEDIHNQFGGRELPYVIGLPVSDLSTGEAIAMWKATGDAAWVNHARDPELLSFVRGGRLYAVLDHTNHADYAHDDARAEAHWYIESCRIQVYLLFHKGDSLLINIGGKRFIEECIYEETNVEWAYKDSLEAGGGDQGIVPRYGLGGIDANGGIIFTNLIYDDRRSYAGTLTEEQLRASGRRPNYSLGFLEEECSTYFYISGDFISFNESNIWSLDDFYAYVIEPEYLIRVAGRSLYVLIPYDEDYSGDYRSREVGRQNHFASGVKIFKMTALN